MEQSEKEQLLIEIQQSAEDEATESQLARLIHRWLECMEAQEASQSLARAVSAQGHGGAIWPQSGIWPLPPG